MIASICVQSVREIRRCCDQGQRNDSDFTACRRRTSRADNFSRAGTNGELTACVGFATRACNIRTRKRLLCFQVATFLGARCRSRMHCISSFCNRSKSRQCICCRRSRARLLRRTKIDTVTCQVSPVLLLQQARKKGHGWAADQQFVMQGHDG